MPKPSIAVPLLLGLLVLLPGAARAGGLYVNEFSTTSQANGGAGRGAWVPDASASLHNPAGMTRLDEHAFSTGLSIAAGDVSFDPDATSPSGTVDGGNQAGVAPLASASYVHRLSERVRLGLDFFSLSGSILDPDDDWAGRFEVTEISLLTVTFAPNVAIELTDWLSIGGGPIATFGVLNWDLAVALPGGGEGRVRLDDLNDWQAAGRLGLLFHPSEGFAVSLSWTSESEFDLSGDVEIPAGLSADLQAELPLAQFIELSVYWQATERLALLGTFDWEDWSGADDLRLGFAGRTIAAATGFQDTFKLALGANYQLAHGWLLQLGFAYDSSALSDADRTTALPIDRQLRGAIGVRHRWSDALTLGLSLVYVDLGRGRVSNATVAGSYESNDLFVVGLTMDFEKLWWAEALRL